MPKMNGTGPAGQGPKTGRGCGPCGTSTEGGFCFCNGCGCGRRRFISPKNELAALEHEEKILEKKLAAIREEKNALENSKK